MQIDANGRLDWNNLSIFRTWPAINSQKVPSAYSYSPSTSSRPRRQWGHDIDDNSEVMRWTKLQLQPKTPSEEIYYLRDLSNGLQRIRELQTNASAMIDNKIPRHITKSAREVVRDYLDEVAREWRQYMTTGARGGQAIFESVPVDIVITHPAVRRQTCQACSTICSA